MPEELLGDENPTPPTYEEVSMLEAKPEQSFSSSYWTNSESDISLKQSVQGVYPRQEFRDNLIRELVDRFPAGTKGRWALIREEFRERLGRELTHDDFVGYRDGIVMPDFGDDDYFGASSHH